MYSNQVKIDFKEFPSIDLNILSYFCVSLYTLFDQYTTKIMQQILHKRLKFLLNFKRIGYFLRLLSRHKETGAAKLFEFSIGCYCSNYCFNKSKYFNNELYSLKFGCFEVILLRCNIYI